MAYYYEVKQLGKWTPRVSAEEPIIRKEEKAFHTKPKKIHENDEGMDLNNLIVLYGTHASREVEFKSVRTHHDTET